MSTSTLVSTGLAAVAFDAPAAASACNSTTGPVTNTVAYPAPYSRRYSTQNRKELFSIECYEASSPMSDSLHISLSKWHWALSPPYTEICSHKSPSWMRAGSIAT